MRSLAITLLLHVVFLSKNACDGVCVCVCVTQFGSTKAVFIRTIIFATLYKKKRWQKLSLTYSLEIKLWKEGKKLCRQN